jgi:hypothetical protein
MFSAAGCSLLYLLFGGGLGGVVLLLIVARMFGKRVVPFATPRQAEVTI